MKVRLALYKGNVETIGRSSPSSLYDQELSSMDIAGGFDQADSAGFIRINALRLKAHRVITKHNQARAVLLSVRRYESLIRDKSESLHSLAAEYDAMFSQMQTPQAHAAGAALFAASPNAAELYRFGPPRAHGSEVVPERTTTDAVLTGLGAIEVGAGTALVEVSEAGLAAVRGMSWKTSARRLVELMESTLPRSSS